MSDAASAWIDLVLSRATDLRAAGVVELAVDGCSVRFEPLPPVPPPPGPKPTTVPEEPAAVDPLYARETYGTGDMPGFDIEPLTEEL